MAHRYHEEVSQLVATIGNPERNGEAIGILRSRVEKVVLTPNETGDDLVIDLHGELAGILAIAMNREKPLFGTDPILSVVKLVAEERLELPTRGL